MGKRSLKASAVGIAKAKQAFQRREWTQDYLASLVGLQTRQSIWKFFSGKPIERPLFVDICFQLNLDWEEIADLPKCEPLPPIESTEPETTEQLTSDSLDHWVKQVRSHLSESIQMQCGTLQTPIDLAQPLTLKHAYTEIELLPYLSNQRWLEASDLQATTADGRPMAGLVEAGNSAQTAILSHPRLLILGKPGAGKTTLLQHLTLSCNDAQLFADHIPVFISLRDIASSFSEPSCTLAQLVQQQWNGIQVPADVGTSLLQAGRILLLLDGLDEVPNDYQSILHQHIQSFADIYPKTRIVITCRLAAHDYQFRSFTCMEVADFSPSQISTFVQKWFSAMNGGCPERGAAKAEQFLKQLQKTENQPIRELAVTPILLHLACVVFQERSAFPKKRSRLYQTGLDILLVRWDSTRGIQRIQKDYGLSISERLSILSQIAITTFEQGKYFFEKAEIIPIISQYLLTLPNSPADPERLLLMSESILKAIVSHHGLLVERAHDVYSFSHVTFQEYLTARRIFTSTSIGPVSAGAIANSQAQLSRLAAQVTDSRWHEVISLTLELLPDPLALFNLMGQQMEAWASESDAVQRLLAWVADKTNSVIQHIEGAHPVAIRAFYLSLAQTQGLDLVTAIAPDLILHLHDELALDLELMHMLSLSRALMQAPSLEQSFGLGFVFDLEHRFQMASGLTDLLRSLHEQLLEATLDQATLENWCHTQGQQWSEQLQQGLINYRNIGHSWPFRGKQLEQLQRYYQTNLFFMQCLQSLTQNPQTACLERQLLPATRNLNQTSSTSDRLCPAELKAVLL